MADTDTRTLFDEVVSDELVAHAERYLVLGLKPVANGEVGCSIVRFKGLRDAFMLGNMFGDVLRTQFGHEMGEQVLLALVESAVLALHGQGIPSGGRHE